MKLAILLALFSFNAMADATFKWTNNDNDSAGNPVTVAEIAGTEIGCGLVSGGYSQAGAATNPPWRNLLQTITGTPAQTTMTVLLNIPENTVFCAYRQYRVMRDLAGGIILDGSGNPDLGVVSTWGAEKSFNPNVLSTVPLDTSGGLTVIIIQ